jgi:hypothetical protein
MEATEEVQDPPESQNGGSEQSGAGSLVSNIVSNTSFEIYLDTKIVLASLRDVSPFVALLKAVAALSPVRTNVNFWSTVH